MIHRAVQVSQRRQQPFLAFILKSINKGHCTLLGFLALSAAFDTVTVDNEELHEVRFMTSCGITGTVPGWFQLLSTGRTFYVLLDELSRNVHQLLCGVPLSLSWAYSLSCSISWMLQCYTRQ